MPWCRRGYSLWLFFTTEGQPLAGFAVLRLSRPGTFRMGRVGFSGFVVGARRCEGNCLGRFAGSRMGGGCRVVVPVAPKPST